eukprot:9322866-Pyramimonas_sp.AAC.1
MRNRAQRADPLSRCGGRAQQYRLSARLCPRVVLGAVLRRRWDLEDSRALRGVVRNKPLGPCWNNVHVGPIAGHRSPGAAPPPRTS